MVSVLQLLAIFLVPAVLIRFRRKRPLSLIGTVGSAYFLGLLIALIVALINKAGVAFSLNADVGEIGSYAAIGVAIPLLLFSTDFREIKRLAKPVLLSFGALVLSVSIVSALAYYLYGRSFTGGRALCAMAAGLYTGGTPNFNAIGVILGADSRLIALGNLSDMLIGGLFYVFILFGAKPLLEKVLRSQGQDAYIKDASPDARNVDALSGSFTKQGLLNVLLSLGIAAGSAGIGLALWAVQGAREGTMIDSLTPSLLIGGTLLGLLFSLNKKVRETPENGLAGHYLILVFSFALASCLDLSSISASFLSVFLLLSGITLCSFLLHVVFCFFLKVDADCAIVTMTAGIYGPAFIPAVTGQLKKEKLTAPGLICGAAGYAIGTFLGSLLYLVFR